MAWWAYVAIGIVVGWVLRHRAGDDRSVPSSSSDVRVSICRSPLLGMSAGEAERFIDLHEERRRRISGGKR